MPDRQALAESLIAHALDHEDVAFQRRDALHALATLAPQLGHGTRARHFTTAMEFAQGDHAGSTDDDLPHTSFDHVSFGFGPATPRPAGLLASGRVMPGRCPFSSRFADQGSLSWELSSPSFAVSGRGRGEREGVAGKLS
jgi:hypothetical protein